MGNKIIIFILILGVVYRLFLTAGGNFLFNMDNARDFVDVREMVEVGKLRLTGPNSAIEGLYNGPLWYYLLAIPYIFTHGDPYGAILMEIVLWTIGGFCLLKLVESFGKVLVFPIGLVWVASDYIVLTNRYSFNPNPVTLLTPLFIYGLVEYIKGKRGWIILVWFLAGAFFNFEMNFGIFMPLIILISLAFISKKAFKDKLFWVGVLVFIMMLLPQVLFDFKHHFIMSKSVIKFLSENKGIGFNLIKRTQTISQSFYSVFEATLMNQKILSSGLLILAVPVFKTLLFKKEKNITAFISLIFITVPFFGYLITSVTVNAWHLGGFAAASIILIAFIIFRFWQVSIIGKVISLILFIFLIFYPVANITNLLIHELGKPNMDPSLFRNEIKAIDYVYKYTDGKNFKVYTYLPSVYDYPYQYLFWWYGRKKYGYIPGEYSYSPNKPQYIPSQDKFQGRKDNVLGLVFLIKEPDRNYTRSGWEGDFVNMGTVGKQMVGPIEIEIKKD